jgi:hypothetical protein
MATRALIGYIENGVLTSTYNHYDGYPDNLGKALNNFFNSPTLAKDVANYGYISYIDSETGEIEAKNSQSPKELDLSFLNPEQEAEKVAVLVDSFGADYAYFYNPNSDGWDVVKNNGIRSMIDPLQTILFGDFDNTYGKKEMEEAYHVGDDKEVVTKENKVDSQETFAKVLSQALLKLKDQPKDAIEAYKKSLANDVRLNGIEQYADYTEEDFQEDFQNYISDKMEMNETHIRQMKYKAGIIK